MGDDKKGIDETEIDVTVLTLRSVADIVARSGDTFFHDPGHFMLEENCKKGKKKEKRLNEPSSQK